jgi:hypothetical protein
VIAGAAALVGRAHLGDHTALALVAASALAAGAIDAHVLGFGPPFLRRQVNEDWLAKYRPWVYGGGFGWQIGAGLTTYVMTAAVPLVVVVGALSGSPAAAFWLGLGFGLTRGLAVLLGAPLRTHAALLAFHRRFAATAEPVRQAVIAVQLAVGVAGVWIVAPAPVAVVASGGAVALILRARPARRTQVPTSMPSRVA